MLLNSISLVDRNNMPSVTSRVGLRVFFINNGQYYDPYDISGVTIFSRLSHITPSSVIDSETNLIGSAILSSIPLMHFGVSAAHPTSALPASSYSPGTNASGVYRVGVGDYVVVLDGTLALSGLYDLHGSALVLGNGASSVQDYIDVWTVKFSQNSDYTVLINEFSLVDNTFFALTEPVLWTITNRLLQKYVTLDSKIDLAIMTELTVTNKGIDSSLKNILKDTFITNPQFLLEKINDNVTALGSRVEVSGFSDTSGHISTTSDNTMLLNFNTTDLKTHAKNLSGDLGGIRGTYALTAKFTVLNQIIKTKPFFFFIE